MRRHPILRDDDPRIAWILRRLYCELLHGGGDIELTTFYDDGMNFLADFSETFPGRVKDPTYMKAKERAYRLLLQMIDRGWVRRYRNSNHDLESKYEPKWLTAYQITTRGIEKFKELERD